MSRKTLKHLAFQNRIRLEFPVELDSSLTEIAQKCQLLADEHTERLLFTFFGEVEVGEQRFDTIAELAAGLPVQKPHCFYCFQKVCFGKKKPPLYKRRGIFRVQQLFSVCARCSTVTDFVTMI